MSKRTVWKFPLPYGPIGMRLTKGFQVVHVGLQGDVPDDQLCAWIEFDPDAPEEFFGLDVIGTGHDVPKDGVHVGAVFQGPFVWHVYQVPCLDMRI